MQASAVPLSPPRASADWLRSPAFDAALLAGVAALALGLGGAAALFPSLFFYVLTFDIWVLAYPHVTSTYTRIAFDRESAKRHWFLLTGLPLLVFAGLSGIAALGGAGGLFTAYYVGQTYHYTRQSYGIARVYRRRAGEPSTARSADWLSDAVVYAVPIWGLLHRAHEGHEVFYETPLFLPRVPAVLAHGVGAITCVLVAVWAVREVRGLLRGNGRYGHAALVGSHVLVTVVSYLVVREITAGWLVVNLWHNAQYLLFVWAFNATRFEGGPKEAEPYLARLCRPRNAWAYALFCLGFGALLYLVLGRVGARLSWGVFPILLVMHLTVNFHHYLVDGVIWKTRRKAAVGAG